MPAVPTPRLAKNSEHGAISNAVSTRSDTLTIEHKAGHRMEHFSKDGEPGIRGTLDGHILEIRTHEFLAMPIAADIQHMGADHSAAPLPEKTIRQAADPA